jgi:ActR/RegA family two-component response regulator
MKTLLWIDDDEKLIDDTTPVFRQNGFHVLKATTPSQALRFLRHQRGQLDGVLLDVRLGGGENGLELLEELGHIHPGVKVVVFTAYPDYSDQVDAKVAGALAYFEKVDKSIPLAPAKQATFFAALHRIFPDHRHSGVDSQPPSRPVANSDISLWVRGVFFLLAFAVVIAGIAVLSQTVSAWTFPVVIVASILLYSVICAFLLRTHPDYGLSEKGFLSLMSESLAITPKLLRGGKKGDGEDAETGNHSEKTEQVAPPDKE